MEFVKVYDFETGIVSDLSASDLTPNMIRIRLNNSDEIYWADASKMGDPKGRDWHPQFTGELKEQIVFIQRALADVYYNTLEYWEDGFRQDLHAQREIEAWFRVAMLYSSFVAGKGYSDDEKQETFSILGACLNGTRDTAMQMVAPKLIPIAEAEGLVDDFYSYR